MATKKPSLNDLLAQLDEQLDALKKRRAELLKKIRISHIQQRKKERTEETRKKLVAGSVLVACAPSLKGRDLLQRYLTSNLSELDLQELFSGRVELLELPQLNAKTSTRRLIVLGALWLDLIDFEEDDLQRTPQIGKLPWVLVRHHFEEHVTRRDQRALFDLPPLSKDAAQTSDAPPSIDLSRPLTWLLGLPLKRDP
jgi:hypothetical protein